MIHHVSRTWYVNNSGAGDWVGDRGAGFILPRDLATFWEFFFTQQQGYGLVTYEQVLAGASGC